MTDALRTAIARLGTAAALARVCNQPRQAVTRWKKEQVPAKYCAAIEAATGVPCEALRGDLLWTRDASGRVTDYRIPVTHRH